MFDVIAIGSATRDNILEVDLTTVPWPKTPSKKAYALPLGEKLDAKGVLSTIGGNAANAAVTFAKQGFKTAAVAKIGRDFPGEELKLRLKKEKVNVDLLAYDPKLPTAYSALILQRGERTIIGYHGASDSFSMKDARLSKMLSKWWYMSLAGRSDRMLKPLLRFAKSKNIAVGFNPSGHHIAHRRGEVLSSLKNISFLAMNDEEAALLTGIPWKKERQVFKKLDGIMPGILAVTEGRKGATISDGKFIYSVGIFKERKLVDRTGAGDAFGAGFVAGLLRRGITQKTISKVKPEDICYAARLATANATANVEVIGATEGTLTAAEFRSPRWKRLPIAITRIK
jgi:sugar/nucleoside kinase (ribokinase family)